ncbi:MAG: NAD(P)-binding protein [Alphaproteobacteria bacterium]|nr:NAD(P)-binding protein [Alphaproteobacteria bacterium]
MKKILIVGAGISGATIARLLAEQGAFMIRVIDGRSHVAGNCYTTVNHGIIEHIYGPHIFHTDQPAVFAFLKKFGHFYDYRHSVKARHDGIYTLPVNLLTICQVYNRELSPTEARALIEKERVAIAAPKNFEEQALTLIGPRLYEKFFKYYTERQWGVKATEIPAYILKRLPLRFNFDDNYFHHPIQAMPQDGYTRGVQQMLDHPLIKVELGTLFDHDMIKHYHHVFYTGKLDEFFHYEYGDLPYRTLSFERHFYKDCDYQGCAVLNNCAPNRGPHDVKDRKDNEGVKEVKGDETRVTEHKYFAPHNLHPDTIISREYSHRARRDDIPYYPVNLVAGNESLGRYQALAQRQEQVSFVGRLASFQYLDMDRAILLATESANKFLQRLS